jgi:CheY-like chemotaxis protein
MFSISTPRSTYVYDHLLVRDQAPSATAPRVLIADDNGDTRETYALYLNRAGYSVETAEDGHEAILKARALRPDRVVMACGHRRQPAALAVGAVSYVMKPGFPEQLAREVGARLTARRNRATSAL